MLFTFFMFVEWNTSPNSIVVPVYSLWHGVLFC